MNGVIFDFNNIKKRDFSTDSIRCFFRIKIINKRMQMMMLNGVRWLIQTLPRNHRVVKKAKV